VKNIVRKEESENYCAYEKLVPNIHSMTDEQFEEHCRLSAEKEKCQGLLTAPQEEELCF
jgi:hypothetical protein